MAPFTPKHTLHDYDRYDYTTTLPPELRRMVCELVSRASLKKIRLVNKRWSNAAASLLWHTFSTDLHEPAGGRNLDALLTSDPGGFFDSIKRLHIRRNLSLSCSLMNTKLLQLISEIPPKTLTKVAIDGDAEIESRTLGLLLRRQPYLQELSACAYDYASGKITGTIPLRYVAGNLSHLTSLTIFSSTSQEGYDAWFPYLTSLITLEVRGRRDNCTSEFRLWNAQIRLEKVQSLHLDNMLFRPASGRLDWWLRLATLEKLTLRGCRNMNSFLSHLAISLAYNPAPSLEELTIVYDSDEDFMEDLEPILKLAPGIKHLYVSTSSSEMLDLLSAICQGSALRSFLMDPINEWRSELHETDERLYRRRDFIWLLENCPNLEELGVYLVPALFNEWDFYRPFAWSSSANRSLDETTLVDQLDAIACFENLRVLRLTQPPLTVDDDEDVEDDLFRERQWRYHSFAEPIMQFLAAKGSPIQLLAFSPTVAPDREGMYSQDAAGHTYPHYYYLRGHSTIQLPSGHTEVQVIAHPVKKADVARYVGSTKILDDPRAKLGAPSWVRK